MSTIQCTVEEFNAAWCEFNRAIGDKSHTQEQIANGWKALVLHYLGIQTDDQKVIEQSAMWLEIAMKGAVRRGWDLLGASTTNEDKP